MNDTLLVLLASYLALTFPRLWQVVVNLPSRKTALAMYPGVAAVFWQTNAHQRLMQNLLKALRFYSDEHKRRKTPITAQPLKCQNN